MKNALVLDRDHLHEMTDGDAEFEKELLATYRDTAAQILAQLRACVAAGDMAGVIREAHALKGASLNIGANAVAQCAADVEIAARNGVLADANEMAQELAREEAALWAELGER